MERMVWIQRVYGSGDVFEYFQDDQELLHSECVGEDRLEDVARCMKADELGKRMPTDMRSLADVPLPLPPSPSHESAPPTDVPAHLRMDPKMVESLNKATW